MMVAEINQLDQRRVRLGMSRAAVAQRANVPLVTVNRILGGKEQSPRLLNLVAIAKVLGVNLRLGVDVSIEELEPAEEYRRSQALQKARRLVQMVQGTMGLESQAVDEKTLERMVEKTMHELLGSNRRLWSE